MAPTVLFVVGLLELPVACHVPWISGAVSPFAIGKGTDRGSEGCGRERWSHPGGVWSLLEVPEAAVQQQLPRWLWCAECHTETGPKPGAAKQSLMFMSNPSPSTRLYPASKYWFSVSSLCIQITCLNDDTVYQLRGRRGMRRFRCICMGGLHLFVSGEEAGV